MNVADRKQATVMEIGWIITATIFMLLASGLILSPEVNETNVLTALQVSSLTTALPFLMLFVAKPLGLLRKDIKQWVHTSHRPLWLILTISHLIHLYQILLFYQQGQSCPLLIWLITSPLWFIMVFFSFIEFAQPEVAIAFFQNQSRGVWRILYSAGIWYTWLVFSIAFGLGSITKHLVFYNVPAFICFLSGAATYGIVWIKTKSHQM